MSFPVTHEAKVENNVDLRAYHVVPGTLYMVDYMFSLHRVVDCSLKCEVSTMTTNCIIRKKHTVHA